MAPDVYWIGPVFSARLAVMRRPLGGDRLDAEIAALAAQGVGTLVCMLMDDELGDLGLRREAAVCGAHGIEFLHWPILDHSVPKPDAESARNLEAIAGRLRAGRNVVCHCYMALGRSVLAAASVMALAGTPPDRAFEAIGRARGIPVPDTREQREWVEQFARDLPPGR